MIKRKLTKLYNQLTDLITEISAVPVPSFGYAHTWIPGDMFSDRTETRSCTIFLQNEYINDINDGKLKFVKKWLDARNLESLCKFAGSLESYTKEFNSVFEQYHTNYGSTRPCNYYQTGVLRENVAALKILVPLFMKYKDILNKYLFYLAESISPNSADTKFINISIMTPITCDVKPPLQVLSKQSMQNFLARAHSDRLRKHNERIESQLAKNILEEALVNNDIKSTLCSIASTLNLYVLPRAEKALTSNDNKKLTAMVDVMNCWAIQHSSSDKFIGALLPDYSEEQLKSTAKGKALLLDEMKKTLSYEHIQSIKSLPQIITLIKTMDSLSYFYMSDACPKSEIQSFNAMRNMILPSMDESSMRCIRDEKCLAVTYGIGSKINKDLISPQQLQDAKMEGCYTGKARFFIPSIKERLEKLVMQFDKATIDNDRQKTYNLGCQLAKYDIPLKKEDREPLHTYAKRHTPWFQKLAADNQSYSSLPMIASPSLSSARSLVTLLHLGAFNTKKLDIDLRRAQIFANCLMGYFVYCGHHSELEVKEIWNRLVDYVAINHFEKILRQSFNTLSDWHSINEEILPYGKIGDYESFLFSGYAERLVKDAEDKVRNKDDLMGFVCDSGLFNQKSKQPEVSVDAEDRYQNRFM